MLVYSATRSLAQENAEAKRAEPLRIQLRFYNINSTRRSNERLDYTPLEAIFQERAVHGLASLAALRGPCRGLLIYQGLVGRA